MKKILSFAILTLLFVNCKEDSKINASLEKDLKEDSIQRVSKLEPSYDKELNDNSLVGNYWSFYKLSENSISGTSKMTKDEIVNQFKNVKIEIDEKKVKIGESCIYDYYKSNKSLTEYYESSKTAKMYENIFVKNKIKLGNEITVYQSLYPEKACEIPWDELIIADNTIIITFDDYLVFFKKQNDNHQSDCYSKTKITNLPITNKIINGNNVWNQLDCNIANLDTKDYLRLPDIKDVKVFIIANFNFDDFTYTLVTIKNDKVITKQDIGFAKDTDEPNTISELTEFEINRDYVFVLNTKSKSGEDLKIKKIERFKIDDNGLIVSVK
ncbi:hypothetical protein JI750_09810 [Flavobacterium sp. GN10]|uniref:Lipoprotein n=1 Tax=Flavobacterium tagetis TaxID=2801336 RepID=A0ABS1KCW1_9FLAO|nr:hypothetical protein [Flavobacterium tagetis]MBL0737180.1 hypothetical protein [Flavobacterium tagetis]